jgi:polysaccharide pyruvyl transferase WcaK-like protein
MWMLVGGKDYMRESLIADAGTAASTRAARAPAPGTIAPLESAAPRAHVRVFGNFGTRNLGNEYTLRAVVANLRRYLPDATVSCICPGPAEVTKSHGIAAVSMSYRASPEFQARARGASSGRLTRFCRRLFMRLPREGVEWARAFSALKGTTMLVMAGTGMLGDFGIGPFDLHYEILKWSLLARMRGAKVLFLSVGAGPVESPLSRWLLKRAAALADYRSYRDAFSLSFMTGLGVDTRRDFVYPDLAFSLRAEASRAADRSGAGRVVGLGLMSYRGKRADGSGERLYRDYVRKAARFLDWLLGRGYAVRLLIGDMSYDTSIREDVVAEVRRLRPGDPPRMIIDAPVGSPETLLEQLAATDLVVATRFHNIVLAMMLNKPVLALSYHPKIASLMAGVGLERYCQSIDELDVDRLIERFIALERDADAVKSLIGRKLEEYAAALDQQYSRIFEKS